MDKSICQDVFGGWWMVTGAVRHKLTSDQKAAWQFIGGIPIYTGSFGQLCVDSSGPV